ncbi:Protein zds1 [Tolypocladium ophioglossoides CBS 100239]|uniref:Protein zds1 n=1 Tax=Tolypocladium ophioglossoides (strain CBS 100239) TaxID=1163406 RepID=A0A0L0N3N2_TOLOC|nr:Protein zds1 [Tolypocladium ophioglossoides CBS 100239]
MMTSSRPRDEVAGSFSSRRGHASQLSISDPSHHVTEAIGTLYGDVDDSGSEGGRPLSFIDGSSYHEQIQRPSQPEPQEQLYPHQQGNDPRGHLTRSASEQPPTSPTPHSEHASLRKTQTLPIPSSSQRSSSFEHGSKPPLSPTLSLRDVQADSVGSQFPLTNIDNPSDIAQELSNLQALRRLSMDVGNNIDPDMPPMSLSAMPMIAPSGDDDENDPSRLLWVPARVHPELAPTEFKSFLEKRVQSIRRRSGDSFISADGDLGRGGSVSSLRRQKSMLSRQIDNSGGRGAVGYVDGAERLKRQRSSGGSQLSPELSLEELVKDPTRAVQRFAQESQGGSSGIEGSGDDMPILPMAPGVGLRRSTRTTYRKGGSLRSGDRGSLSRRLAHRHQQDGESSGAGSPPRMEAPKGHSLARVQSEPIAENYSRPKRSVRRQNNFSQDSMVGADGPSEDFTESRTTSPPHVHQDQLPIRTSSASTSTTIMEPTLPQERAERLDNQYDRSFPQRSSSQSTGPPQDHQPEIVVEEPPPRSSRRSSNNNIMKQPAQPQYTSKSPPPTQTMNDTLPSSLSGGDASRTDNLTFIPTLSQVEKKPEKKSKKDRDEEPSSSRSGSAWKWFKGVTDDREKKKEESKRSKTKALVERAQDNVRLDVIQTSIDKNAVKGRESLVLDRDNVDSKLLEERKRESHRKSDSKRDKDGSIFSSIFGGSKKKEEKEKANKKSQHLQVPEDPPYKPMQPDVDYNWTRFPLLEERAIYRMAHIKLANPRRSLLSQVLLSNFMYSYLAIVQAMHPQMNVPTSPQQKRLEEEARRKQQEQEYRAQQQARGDEDAEHSLDQYNFDYHRAAVQYADSGTDGQVEYVDDAQIYEDEHRDDDKNNNDDDDEGYD